MCNRQTERQTGPSIHKSLGCVSVDNLNNIRKKKSIEDDKRDSSNKKKTVAAWRRRGEAAGEGGAASCVRRVIQRLQSLSTADAAVSTVTRSRK